MEILSALPLSPVCLPLLVGRVRAGFPSPAEEYEEAPLNIHHWLVAHEAATFLLRYSGELLPEAHICPGDILVVDRSLRPETGDLIVGVLQGEMRVFTWRGRHTAYEGDGWLVWGVVVGVARKRRGHSTS